MKKLIFSAAIVLSSVSAFAQVSPSQVCQKLSYSPTNASRCAQIISRSTFDQGGLTVAMILAGSNSTETVNALTVIANRRVEAEASSVCAKLATYSPTNAVACLDAISDKSFYPTAVRVAMIIAASNSTETVNALKVAPNAFMNESAGRTCEKLATYSPTNAVRCLAAIAGKDYLNGSESVCLTIAQSNSTEAVNCLVNSGIAYNPGPVPHDVLVSSFEIRDLKRNLTKARTMLERGETDKAMLSLQDALRTVKELEIRK